MNPDFAEKLDLQVYKTIVDVQKIDGTKLDTFGIVIVLFFVEDKEEWFQFFERSFLLADISMNIALERFFLSFSNIEINFIGRYIYFKTYTVARVLLTPK